MVDISKLGLKDITLDFIEQNFNLDKERKRTKTKSKKTPFYLEEMADTGEDFFLKMEELKIEACREACAIMEKRQYKNCTFKFLLKEDYCYEGPTYEFVLEFDHLETDIQVKKRLQSNLKKKVQRRIAKENEVIEDKNRLLELKSKYTPEQIEKMLSE